MLVHDSRREGWPEANEALGRYVPARLPATNNGKSYFALLSTMYLPGYFIYQMITYFYIVEDAVERIAKCGPHGFDE